MLGAKSVVRAAITLLKRGAQRLSGRSSPTCFVNRRQEAMAKIAHERTRLPAQKTGKVPKLP